MIYVGLHDHVMKWATGGLIVLGVVWGAWERRHHNYARLAGEVTGWNILENVRHSPRCHEWPLTENFQWLGALQTPPNTPTPTTKLVLEVCTHTTYYKGFVSVLHLVSKQLRSSRLHCSDVEWVPLPTTVFEKVVKCWGYTLVCRMGTLNGGPGAGLGRIHTPASLSSEHSSKREGLK